MFITIFSICELRFSHFPLLRQNCSGIFYLLAFCWLFWWIKYVRCGFQSRSCDQGRKVYKKDGGRAKGHCWQRGGWETERKENNKVNQKWGGKESIFQVVLILSYSKTISFLHLFIASPLHGFGAHWSFMHYVERVMRELQLHARTCGEASGKQILLNWR